MVSLHGFPCVINRSTCSGSLNAPGSRGMPPLSSNSCASAGFDDVGLTGDTGDGWSEFGLTGDGRSKYGLTGDTGDGWSEFGLTGDTGDGWSEFGLTGDGWSEFGLTGDDWRLLRVCQDIHTFFGVDARGNPGVVLPAVEFLLLSSDTTTVEGTRFTNRGTK